MITTTPTNILRTVDNPPRLRVVGGPIPTPRRPKNGELRPPREFLTAQEVDKLVAMARKRGRLMLQFRGSTITSDTGLLLYREWTTRWA